MSLLSRRPSPPSARARWTPLAIALGAGALLTLPGLGGFGIWDPWELAVADLGRGLIDGTARLDRPPLGPWLVGASFALFGIDEAVGRLPMALSGLAVALLAYATAARFVDRRAGGWAAIVAVSSPFMVLHARQMLGQTPAFAASGAIFFCALSLLYLPAPFGAPHPQVRRNATLLGLGLAASWPSGCSPAASSGPWRRRSSPSGRRAWPAATSGSGVGIAAAPPPPGCCWASGSSSPRAPPGR
jgi:4-amino-4-deoxy-L-arabinose transferase-like glycosyltransferase